MSVERGEIAVQENGGILPLMTKEQLIERKRAIEEIQRKVMTKDVDYGIIPGCKRPTLLKPGAETINLTFGLHPITNPNTDIRATQLPGGHVTYEVAVHIMNNAGQELATGVGVCSTMETKYRYRKAEQTCPQCHQPAIIRGKQEYGGGWICFKRKGGCGAKFKDGDPAIENQEMGRIEYDNPADYYNTVLKIAKKRGLVDGVLNATAASHVFTQDVEELGKGADPEDADVHEAEVGAPDSWPEEAPSAPSPTPPPAAAPKKAAYQGNGKTTANNGERWWSVSNTDKTKVHYATQGKCQECGKENVFLYEGSCFVCRHK